MNKKFLPLILTLSLFLSACGNAAAESTGTPEIYVRGAPENAAGSAAVEITASDTDPASYFSDRDYESSYDSTAAVFIKLNGTSAEFDSSAVSLSDGAVIIGSEGVYILSGSFTGMVIIEAKETDKVQLVLDGADIMSQSSAAIYVKQADKVFITLAANSENSLSNGGEFLAIDENNIDAALFSKEDLCLNGSGALSISSSAGHGIVSKDELRITGGSYEIAAASHGLSGKDSVCIAGGSFQISSGEDGIHASNSDDESLGFIYISGGSFEISAVDDGIHADAKLIICGGDIAVNESYEGLEGLSIQISGGDIRLCSTDDGLNAAGGVDQSGFGEIGGDAFSGNSDSYILISGGNLEINASGDGIDSNGSLKVDGGTTYVSGPVDGGNSALDFGGGAVITGGIFLAAGSSQMAQNFGQSSTQGVMMVNIGSQKAGCLMTLSDSSGNELISWAPDKAYESVIISCPEIVQGAEYILAAGSSSTQISMDALVYGSSEMGFDGMGGAGRQPGGMPSGPRPEGEAATGENPSGGFGGGRPGQETAPTA